MDRGRSRSPGGITRSRSRSPGGITRSRSRSPGAHARSRSRSPGTMTRGRSTSPSGGGRGRGAAARSRSRSIGKMSSHSVGGASVGAGSTSGGVRSRSKSPGGVDGRRKRYKGIRKLGRRLSARNAFRGREGPPREGDPLTASQHRRRRLRPKKTVRKIRKSKFGKRVGRSRVGRTVKRIAPKETCSFGKVLSYIIPILLIIISSIGLIVATGNAAKITPNIGNLAPRFDTENLSDPFSGSSTEILKWDNKNGGSGGLEINFINALDDKFQVTYALAIADWDFGVPDALTIATEKVDYDPECDPQSGYVKVCNNDYGNVPWRGINDITKDGSGFITSSVARINEFYVIPEGPDSQQYTMCHEIGHAFGLRHTDEDFTNEDLGNCLDYTKNFGVNKHPDVTNYETLISLYGEVGGRRRRTSGTTPTSSGTYLRGSQQARQEQQQQQQVQATADGSRFTKDTTKLPPDHVTERHRLVRKELDEYIQKYHLLPYEEVQHENDDKNNNDQKSTNRKYVHTKDLELESLGWKLIHRHTHGEGHAIDLGDGYSAEVHFLWGTPKEQQK